MMIWIHLIAATLALALGTLQVARVSVIPRGGALHRLLGRLWIAAMALTAVSSFWIHSAFAWWRGFGPVHLLSVWVLFCLVMVVYGARRGRIKQHRNFAVGAYLGLVGAGLGALAPGRLVNGWLF